MTRDLSATSPVMATVIKAGEPVVAVVVDVVVVDKERECCRGIIAEENVQ